MKELNNREKERVNKMSHHNGDQRGIEGKETPGKESLKQNGDSGRVGGCEIQLIWKKLLYSHGDV